MKLASYLGLLEAGLGDLAAAFRTMADGHAQEPDVLSNCQTFAADCDRQAEVIGPFVERYGTDTVDEPDRLHAELFDGARSGGLGLVRDLQDLYVMGHYVDITFTLVGQAAKALRDRDLIAAVAEYEHHTASQLRWLQTRMKQAAPQALVVS